MTQSMNHEAVYRTAPATPGLLKKRTLISNLILSNKNNFQKHRNSGQFQYKEGLYVIEALFYVFVFCAVCIVQSAYLKNLALTKRTLISNPD